MRAAVFAIALGLASAGIYPDGHFDVSTKLTKDNYQDIIQQTIDADQTLMEFANSKAVKFADVNLSEEQIREGADGTSFSPGAGGWPTIRYFNKETGVGGAPYDKKKDGAMCDVLGKEENMREYVEQASGATACSAFDGEGCDEKQAEYAEKWRAKDAAEVASQLERLTKMSAGAMKPEAAKWLKQRTGILKQLAGAAKAEL